MSGTSEPASSDWLDTPALCRALAVSRSTLTRWRRRGLLAPGHHCVRKNPACPVLICSGTGTVALLR
jgi:hypothetical protein